jgi:hypothetical protein
MKWQPAIPDFNLPLIASWIEFWFVRVVPKYLNCSTLSKELLSICILWLHPAVWSGDITRLGDIYLCVTFISHRTQSGLFYQVESCEMNIFTEPTLPNLPSAGNHWYYRLLLYDKLCNPVPWLAAPWFPQPPDNTELSHGRVTEVSKKILGHHHTMCFTLPAVFHYLSLYLPKPL